MRSVRVLFLCTHNSARSQMAEGLLRHLSGGAIESHSAGTKETFVRPLARRAMEEAGIDIGAQESKTLDRFREERFDAVVTLCDHAKETCPVFPGARRTLHWSLPDPSAAMGSEEEQFATYCNVRDGLRDRIEALIRELSAP